MAFYLVFSVHIYVIMLRLVITKSLCTIIIIIKQVSPSSKIIIIFKTIIIKVHATFLNIYHYIINDDPVLSTAIRFHFSSEIVGCSDKHLEFAKLKKSFYGPFQLIGFISILQLYRLPMKCNRVPSPISSPRIL